MEEVEIDAGVPASDAVDFGGGDNINGITSIDVMDDFVRGETLGVNPPESCVELYNEYTDNGKSPMNVIAAPSVQNVLDKCVHTGNKGRCGNEYDKMIAQVRPHGIERASSVGFPDEWRKELLECRDDNSWSGSAQDAWHGITTHPYGAISDTGTAVWDGSNWVMGQTLSAGTAVAGKVWDGTKWIAGSAVTVAVDFGKVVGNYVWDGAKWVGGTAKNVGMTIGTTIWDGSKWVAGTTVNAGTEVAGKVWDGAKWVVKGAGSAAMQGAQWVDEKVGLSASILRWVVYMFLVTQVIIEVFGTLSELFGIKTSMATRMTVIGITAIQLLFAMGLVYFKKTSIDVGLWMGAIYYGAVFVGAAVSSGLGWARMASKPEEESRIFDIIGLGIKAIQLLVCLIFGVLFFLWRDKITGMGSLQMYVVLAVAGTELISQILRMIGLN